MRQVLVKVTGEVFNARDFQRIEHRSYTTTVTLQDNEADAQAIDFALELMPDSTEWPVTPPEDR